MEEIKKVVILLLENFLKEEHGNRVTQNNMMALGVQIGQALDGKIVIDKPETPAEEEVDGNK
jgi:hypothetical protein